MPKIIFLDVDGTLVDYETKIPDSAITASAERGKTDIGFTFVQAAARRKFIRNCGTSDWTG